MIRKISLALLVLAHCSDDPTPTNGSDPPLSPRPILQRTSGRSALPASGGTLLVQRDVHYAWVGNPDADAIEIVSIDNGALIETINLRLGSEPGRMVEDSVGRVHVVLRGAGAVLSVDRAAHRKTIQPVCPAPRGITANRGTLWIACAGGELVRMVLDGSAPETVGNLGRDLRDVVVTPDGFVRVSKFRTGEIVTWNHGRSPTTAKSGMEVAWRMVPVNGGWAVLGQGLVSSYYGNFNPVTPSVVSTVDSNVSRLPLSGNAIDLAVSSSGDVAVAAFGQLGDEPRIQLARPSSSSFGDGGLFAGSLVVDDHPVAVAFAADGRLVVQTRKPSLMVETARGSNKLVTFPLHTYVPEDPGFEIFHTITTIGVACASCHPEGGEDGRTWHFTEGPRRTQSLRGGVLKTAPFHWTGDLEDMKGLVTTVYTGRMFGKQLRPEEVNALAHFVDGIPPLPLQPVDATKAARGRAIFENASCGSCHSGEAMTDNRTHDVGTTDPLEGGVTHVSFQTPSLLGVGARAPYMHDGCAPTLAARFLTPSCGGGAAHGRILDAADVADLVEYLESL